MKCRMLIPLSLAFFLLAPAALSQGLGTPQPPGENKGDPWFKKKKTPENSLFAEGSVLDPKGKLVKGAVVKLKDVKTLEIRSFITLKDGTYRFSGLSLDNDYELQATFEKQESRVRRISVFESRKKLAIDLKLKEPNA